MFLHRYIFTNTITKLRKAGHPVESNTTRRIIATFNSKHDLDRRLQPPIVSDHLLPIEKQDIVTLTLTSKEQPWHTRNGPILTTDLYVWLWLKTTVTRGTILSSYNPIFFHENNCSKLESIKKFGLEGHTSVHLHIEVQLHQLHLCQKIVEINVLWKSLHYMY